MKNYTNENAAQTVRRWHEFVETSNAEILSEIIADDIKFHSPFVWKPKEGKAAATTILLTVMEVFLDFRYIREISEGNFLVLEFEARIGEFSLRGVDLIEISEQGKIIDFEVMIRPANALQILGAEMNRRLAAKFQSEP